MNAERYNALTRAEFDKAADTFDGDDVGMYAMCREESNEIMEEAMPQFCQSCGMPLTQEFLGTDADGSTNFDYCMWCYRDGHFMQDITMEGMIAHCLQYLDEMNAVTGLHLSPEEAKRMMAMQFPKLKRWSSESKDKLA